MSGSVWIPRRLKLLTAFGWQEQAIRPDEIPNGKSRKSQDVKTGRRGNWGTLSQSVREVKWKDLLNVTWVMRGKSKASVSGVATRLLPHAEYLVTPGHHVSSSCFLSGSASHHSITTLSAPTPLPSLKPLPKWKLWSPWSSCSEDRNRGYFHGVTSATRLLAPLSPFHVLHMSELTFPDHASHFFSLLLLLFYHSNSFMCFSRNIWQFLLI